MLVHVRTQEKKKNILTHWNQATLIQKPDIYNILNSISAGWMAKALGPKASHLTMCVLSKLQKLMSVEIAISASTAS